jgi:acetoin utilization deacetylase AcuC-like enzyme
MTKTAVLYDQRCLKHDNGSMILDQQARGWLDARHVETAERITRSITLLERSGVADALARPPVTPATTEQLRLVHSDGHIKHIQSSCSGPEPTTVGPEARVGRGSWEAAVAAVGAAIGAVNWTLAEPERNAYVLTRPPGHHASTDRAMGYCLFNSAAILPRYAQLDPQVARVAIIDWDVHHGNGTQEIFYEDPSVLFISLHQAGLYPARSGLAEHTGRGRGDGYTVNIPLPAGSGDAAYLVQRV